ncbi:MAG: hypothetical protein ACE5LU_06785 [Anaerolineae bacterium]
MVKARGATDKARDRKEDVRAASQELARSLCRLGLAVATSPIRLLPEETQGHLRSAGREAVRAGIALNRGVLEASEKALADVQARLDEIEEKVSPAE